MSKKFPAPMYWHGPGMDEILVLEEVLEEAAKAQREAIRDQQRMQEVARRTTQEERRGWEWGAEQIANRAHRAEQRTAQQEAEIIAQVRSTCIVCGTNLDHTEYYCDECFQLAVLAVETKQKTVETKRKAGYNKGRWAILHRDNFQCIYCGKSSYGDCTQLHVDHIVPRSVGGLDTISNLVTSCIRCNLEKHVTRLQNEDTILREVARRNHESGLPPGGTIKGLEKLAREGDERD